MLRFGFCLKVALSRTICLFADYCKNWSDREAAFPCGGEFVSCYIWCDRYHDCPTDIDEKWCLKQRVPYAVMNSGNETLIAELSWAWRIMIIIRSKDEHQIANLTAAQHVWWIMKFGTAFEKQALNHVYREWFQANATLQRLGPDPSVTLPSPLMTSTTTPIRRQGFDLFIELFFF